MSVDVGSAGAARSAPAARGRVQTAVSASARDLSLRASAVVLAAIVAGSTLASGLAARGVHSIWILPDEWVYGSLARSFAETGQFALRGVHTIEFPVGYPLLLAPAFVGRDPTAAYAAAKWLNALLLSLAAVPVFLIARRLLPNWLALVSAGFALLIPSLAYAGVLMSENAFYPLFLLALLAQVRAIERPTAARQLVALVAIVPVVATRAEGLVLVPALLVAIAAFALGAARRSGGSYLAGLGRELSRFRVTALALVVALVGLPLGELAAGRSATSVLGRYGATLQARPRPATFRWLAYELVDLQLYLAVLPFVTALVVACALLWRAETTRARRATAAATLAATIGFVAVAAQASSGAQGGSGGYPYLPPNVHDRYDFFLAPLFLTFFVYWLVHRRAFSRRLLLPPLVVASALPLLLPFASVHSNADFDALALLPWNNSLVAGRHVPIALACTVAILSVLVLVRRSSLVLLQVGVVVFGLWFMGSIARHQISQASVRVASSHEADRAWVDRAVPPGTRVAGLWVGGDHTDAGTVPREQALWQAEFFNPSVERFYYVRSPMHYRLPEEPARLVDGVPRLPSGGAVPFRYVLTTAPTRLRAEVVARDAKARLVLYRIG